MLTYRPNNRAQEFMRRDEFIASCEDMGVSREYAITYAKSRQFFGNADLYRVGANGRHFYDIDPMAGWAL